MAEQKLPPAKILRVDRPEMHETFADSVHSLIWDGRTLRLEFDVTRYPDVTPGDAAQATRYPAARLVLTPRAAADLYKRLQHTIAAVVKEGLIAQAAPSPAGTA
jgi:hypothetical protein